MVKEIIQKYYEAFNKGVQSDFLALLTDDVIHDINQDKQEKGKEAFKAFMDRMNKHYKENNYYNLNEWLMQVK